MNRSLLLVVAALGIALTFGSAAWGQDHDGDSSSVPLRGNPPMEFDHYWMVFLQRGADPPKLDENALAELQRKHLAHLSRMHDEGYSLVAGPFEVPADERLRGIVLYRGDLDREKVVELAGADPMVEAGRLEVRVMKWWTPAGAMRFAPPDGKDASSHEDP